MSGLGALLGEGKCRRVFAHPESPHLVIKVAKSEKGLLAQRNECLTWKLAEGTQYEEYFAPVEWWSEDFAVAHQVRGRPPTATDRHRLPIQDWMLVAADPDTKLKNWGWIGGKLVLVDYSSHFEAIRELTDLLRSP